MFDKIEPTLYMVINVAATEETQIVYICDKQRAELWGKLLNSSGGQYIGPPMEGRGFSKLSFQQLQYLYWNTFKATPPDDYAALITECLNEAKRMSQDTTDPELLIDRVKKLTPQPTPEMQIIQDTPQEVSNMKPSKKRITKPAVDEAAFIPNGDNTTMYNPLDAAVANALRQEKIQEDKETVPAYVERKEVKPTEKDKTMTQEKTVAPKKAAPVKAVAAKVTTTITPAPVKPAVVKAVKTVAAPVAVAKAINKTIAKVAAVKAAPVAAVKKAAPVAKGKAKAAPVLSKEKLKALAIKEKARIAADKAKQKHILDKAKVRLNNASLAIKAAQVNLREKSAVFATLKKEYDLLKAGKPLPKKK